MARLPPRTYGIPWTRFLTLVVVASSTGLTWPAGAASANGDSTSSPLTDLLETRIPISATGGDDALTGASGAAPNVQSTEHQDGLLVWGATLHSEHYDWSWSCPWTTTGWASLQLDQPGTGIAVPGPLGANVELRVFDDSTGVLLAENLLPGAYKVVGFTYEACHGLRLELYAKTTALAGVEYHLFINCLGHHVQNAQGCWQPPYFV